MAKVLDGWPAVSVIIPLYNVRHAYLRARAQGALPDILRPRRNETCRAFFAARLTEAHVSDLEVFSKPRLISAEPNLHTHPRTATSDAAIRIAWTLHRRKDSARCVLWAVGDRVELHITTTHDVVMAQQCSRPDQAAAISSGWWLALVSRGWVDDNASVRIKPTADRRAGRTDQPV